MAKFQVISLYTPPTQAHTHPHKHTDVHIHHDEVIAVSPYNVVDHDNKPNIRTVYYSTVLVTVCVLIGDYD